MCRLFGMNAGTRTVRATYWLKQAPDSVEAQSLRNPDGAGIGWFDAAGHAKLHKEADAAFSDSAFGADAAGIRACTLITHIRAATTGHNSVDNTHPFLIENRLMAHNGGFGDLPALESELGTYRAMVHGDTDSERFAALIAKFSDAADGDIGAGLTEAATWISRNLPMYSLNCLVATQGNLWALRYPDQRALHLARRVIDAKTGEQVPRWDGHSQSADHELAVEDGEGPADVVIVASERIDAGENWRMLEPGELIHVGPDLTITSNIVLHDPPVHLHVLDEPDPNDDSF